MCLKLLRESRSWSQYCKRTVHALARAIPRNNTQTSRCLYPLLCSGHGRQGSSTLELWLPRDTACTVHLATATSARDYCPKWHKQARGALVVGRATPVISCKPRSSEVMALSRGV